MALRLTVQASIGPFIQTKHERVTYKRTNGKYDILENTALALKDCHPLQLNLEALKVYFNI